jgi:hypothetical protein
MFRNVLWAVDPAALDGEPDWHLQATVVLEPDAAFTGGAS